VRANVGGWVSLSPTWMYAMQAFTHTELPMRADLNLVIVAFLSTCDAGHLIGGA